ncbi:hypothetical protein IFM89_026746 [Coptis chinensis]|uniref:RanBP2-type domain-containing protein n=1 Tax=Coptis chinensis TaxID=261450 RepID=A0A835IFY2_9MAGN|nr:hypothetical protein IFM89_026746 [Coptis chinensis]
MEEESPPAPQYHLSSLVVRPSDSGGGCSDYEPGEVRPDPPPYSRSDRYNDSSDFKVAWGTNLAIQERWCNTLKEVCKSLADTRITGGFGMPGTVGLWGWIGHMMRTGSVSPMRHRKLDDRYRSDFENSSGPRVMHAGSISPLHHGKVDDRYRPDFDGSIDQHVMHAGSVSHLRRRKLDNHCRSDFDISSGPHAMCAGSVSPLHQRKLDDRYRSDFDTSSRPHGGRGFGGGRGSGRFRDFSPPYGRGRGGGRSYGRDFNVRGFGRGSFRNDGMTRNSANVAPRDGDWVCPALSCGNLNFARREYCNKCNRPRLGAGGSPRRNYLGPPRFSGHPLDRSPVRGGLNGYRSPPRGGWGRGGPREFRDGPPHIRHGGRFPDPHIRRDRQEYPEEDFREMERFDRPVPPDWGERERGRDGFFNGRRAYDARNERQPLSPPPQALPSRDRWAHQVRERSRSPMMGGPLKDQRQDSYVDRGRGPRWGLPRDRFDGHPY